MQQPNSRANFAALNKERHLYSAGRPSRWALAHILVNSAYVYGLPPTSVKYSTIKQPYKAVAQYDSVQRHTLGRRNTVQQYGIANKTMQQCSLFTLTGKNMNMTEHDRKTRVVNLRLGSVVCYYTTLSVIQGSDVADKPVRRAASQQTAKCKNGHVTINTPVSG